MIELVLVVCFLFCCYSYHVSYSYLFIIVLLIILSSSPFYIIVLIIINIIHNHVRAAATVLLLLLVVVGVFALQLSSCIYSYSWGPCGNDVTCRKKWLIACNPTCM